MKGILHILVNKWKLKSAECDQVLFQFSTFIDTCTLNGCLSKSNWEHDRLDIFFIEQLGSKISYVNIWKIVRDLLLLSHGQASVERGFSENRSWRSVIWHQRYWLQKGLCWTLRQSPDLDNFVITPTLFQKLCVQKTYITLIVMPVSGSLYLEIPPKITLKTLKKPWIYFWDLAMDPVSNT